MGSAFAETRSELSAPGDRVRLLRAHGPLFAILDAARDPRVLDHLRDDEGEHRSLYAGRRGEHLAAVAPYLAQIVPESKLERAIVGEGWGRSWGVLLTAEVPFAEVRRHLRRYLVVETEDAQPLSFRFYDPRVLPAFLRSATAAEARRFFGPVTSFFAEEGAGGLLRFERSGAAVVSAEVSRELPRIREAQMKVFSRAIVERFVGRMAERYGLSLAVIREGIARAGRQGITETGDVERYMAVLAVLGAGFEERLPWARGILGRAGLEGRQKMSRIERRMRQRG